MSQPGRTKLDARTLPWRTRLLRWSRRAHLYCGLALLPWVCLYGITGLFFNHPGLGGDSAYLRFGRSDLPPGVTKATPAADMLALRVAEQLGPGVVLNDLPPPSYEGSLRAKGTLGAQELRVFLSASSGNGSIRLSDPEPKERPPSLEPLAPIDPEGRDAAAWEAMARGVADTYLAQEAADSTMTLELERAPTLRFGARVDGEPWVVEYQPAKRELHFERPDERPAEIKRLLMRLHMTHMYPDSVGARWVHALFVDLTAGCLLLWCLTGILMWWQMRKLRRVGAVVLLSGFAAVLWLMVQVLPGML